ncbi:MAG: tetratricopeptide repeat protein [Nitrospiraceae bacterium]|nr:tetratricopeptide repeat protein [Nitrospiraceae bacterium]
MKLAALLAGFVLAAVAYAGQTAPKELFYYYDLGDWQRVIAEYRAHTADYASTGALSRVAEAYYYSGDLDAAEETALRPQLRGNADAAVVVALVKAGKGDRAGAMRDLDAMKPQGREAARVYMAMGIVNFYGNGSAALPYFEKAVAADPDYGRGWFYMGLVCEIQERFEDASKAYGRAVQAAPLYAQAQNNLGYSFKERHFYQYAVEHYLRAIELIPDNAGYYYNLGNAYTHQEKIDEAFLAYKKALELDPTFAKAHYNMARTYLRKDMVKEAIAEFRLYLKDGSPAVFDFVASMDSVEGEIEQLEAYLRNNPPVKPPAGKITR